ncbi:hypothetical protein [Winogradskyella forsetii]|uniref:hypothetical protein n=1 Tax=Winogradskyella forsetii TaxID=2686077 RepID=UPI0015B9251B|nr:hypothetical protein [Winogradskyella forsetii]
MKYWSDIRVKLTRNIQLALQLLLLMIGIYIFIMADKLSLYKIPLIFVGLLSWFFFRDKTKHPIIWLVVLTLLVLDLYHFYFRVANHHFMLIFMVFSIILYKYHKRRDILLKNIQILLVVVLTASALQKLMSEPFMSGDFYYYMMNRGFVFHPFLNFFPESLDIANNNTESINALHQLDPNSAKSIKLKDVFLNLESFSFIFAWLTVVIEFIIAIALLWKPRGMWTNLFFATLIIGILCTRLETGFMGLLGICGLILCNNFKIRLLYILIVIGSLSLIVTKFGFH